jgi:hypothetical protein
MYIIWNLYPGHLDRIGQNSTLRLAYLSEHGTDVYVLVHSFMNVHLHVHEHELEYI